MKDFIETLNELLFYIHEYGYLMFNLKEYRNQDKDLIKDLVIGNQKHLSKETSEKFIIYCHEGFNKAQELLIDRIIKTQETIKQLKERIKNASKNHDGELRKSLSKQTESELFKEKVYRRFSDAIAWILIDRHSAYAKRLYIRRECYPSMSNSNIESTIAWVNNFNKNNPLGFALLADITSFICIGDILCRDCDQLKVIEVKEGIENERIQSVIEKIVFEEPMLTPKDVEENYGKKFSKQLQRVLSQYLRLFNASEIISTGSGKSLDKKYDIQIINSSSPDEKFDITIHNMLEDLDGNNRDWGFDIIEDVLYIGVYKKHFPGANILREVVARETGKNFPIFDFFLGSLDAATSEPIFLKPFSKNQMKNLVLGKTKIYMSIDFNGLIEKINENYEGKFQCDWASRKKTERVKQEVGFDGLFTFEKRSISVKYANGEFFMGGGLVAKIIYDTILPSSVTTTWLESIESRFHTKS